MSTITIYPRLYTTRRPFGDGIVTSQGDVTVETLFGFLQDRTVNTTGWTYRKKVLECALRMFGNIDEWFKDQRNNPRITGYNLEFLKDTLQYIRTGVRQMDLPCWAELVAEENSHAAEPTHLIGKSLALGAQENTIEIIQKWCSHQNGFEDLVGTLHVLFGQARQSLLPN